MVLAVDIGGDKLIASRYVVREDRLCRTGPPHITDGADGGAGYLRALEDLGDAARADNIPVGVSYAGPVQGSRVLAGVNVPAFVADFQAKYNCDFLRIGGGMTLVNDAEAGLFAAAVEAARSFPGARNIIYTINGSGIGCAVLARNEVATTEAGHVPVVHEALNQLRQRAQCGLLGATHVCLERIGASKAGIESLWAQQTRTPLTGRQIAARYLTGDDLALRLYETSALTMAHIVKGVATALGLVSDWGSTVVVGHGGTFHVPEYGDRVRSILMNDLDCEIQLLLTKDFSVNACLDGAAIAGIRLGD
jgi:predicted NBD/HSP70 family sugar kinase